VATGFTLVELLVVIGIIVVLIGILLPSLSRARATAQRVKCSASLQQVGQGFILYGTEFNGYWPPMNLIDNTNAYTIGDDSIPAKSRVYWYNFIGPEVAASAGMGYAANAANSGAKVRTRNVLWGCPNFTGYQGKGGQSAGDDVNRYDTGYGMNGWPLYSEDDTSYDPTGPSGTEPNGTNGDATSAVQYTSGNLVYGRWFKQTDYTRPAQRGLVADTTFYMLESRTVGSPTDDPSKFPQNVVTQNAVGASNLWQVPGQTTVDLFRHGKPADTKGSGSSTVYSDSGGTVGYNMLYCDGHVEAQNQAKEAYRAMRQRFPG